MNRAQFINRVMELNGTKDSLSAEQGSVITLNLFRHIVGAAESQRVKSNLDPELAELWHSEEWYTTFLAHFRSHHYDFRSTEELYGLVREELEDRELSMSASELTQAVLHALRENMTPLEAQAVAARLPAGIQELWANV